MHSVLLALAVGAAPVNPPANVISANVAAMLWSGLQLEYERRLNDAVSVHVAPVLGYGPTFFGEYAGYAWRGLHAGARYWFSRAAPTGLYAQGQLRAESREWRAGLAPVAMGGRSLSGGANASVGYAGLVGPVVFSASLGVAAMFNSVDDWSADPFGAQRSLRGWSVLPDLRVGVGVGF